MKRILASLVLSLLIFSSVAYAEETASQSEQKADVQDNKATFAILKQPTNGTSKQDVFVKNNWFSFVVVVNGKTPFDPTSDR